VVKSILNDVKDLVGESAPKWSDHLLFHKGTGAFRIYKAHEVLKGMYFARRCSYTLGRATVWIAPVPLKTLRRNPSPQDSAIS
jgi:hypothetical protein